MILASLGIIAGKGSIPSTLLTNLYSVYKAESNANDSFGTNNGTAVGGLTYTTGKSGNSFTYNGSNAYVQLPNNSLNFTTDFSISVWVNLVGVSNVEPLVNNFKQFNSNYYGYLLFVYNSNLYFRICDGVSSNVYDITTAFTSTSTWKHIVITRKRSVITKVYIDGILITSANTVNQGYESTMQYARIGGYNDLSGDRVLSNGSKVDEVGLWTKELTSTEVTELYRCGSGSFYPYVSLPTLDSDACAFIGAASITDTTQQSAINQLVLDLKSANIWTKMKAIYPFVGGTASSHKFNLKDPRDLDAAFRLVFNGGWTHSSTGALPNGTTAYADTKLIPSSNLTKPFIGYYSRTNTNTGLTQIDMGNMDSTRYLWISAWYNTGGYSNILARNSSVGVLLDGGTTSDSRGWYWTNKIGTTAKIGKNSTILNTASDTDTPPSLYTVAIGCLMQNTGPAFYTNRETAFSVIADGMSDTDTTNLYTAVQTYQTTLSRNV